MLVGAGLESVDLLGSEGQLGAVEVEDVLVGSQVGADLVVDGGLDIQDASFIGGGQAGLAQNLVAADIQAISLAQISGAQVGAGEVGSGLADGELDLAGGGRSLAIDDGAVGGDGNSGVDAVNAEILLHHGDDLSRHGAQAGGGGQHAGVRHSGHILVGQSVHRVGEHDGDPLTGSIAHGGIVIAAQQADDGSVGQDVLVPVGAGVAADFGRIADGGQQHLGDLSGGDGIVGTELAIAVALDQLGHAGVVDVALGPVAGHVGEQIAVLVVDALVVIAVVGDDIDHLGNLGTGDEPVGVEIALVVALHDVQDADQFDGFFALGVDVRSILILGLSISAGENRQCEDHRQSQRQREQFLQSAHGLFLLIFFGSGSSFPLLRTCFRKVPDLPYPAIIIIAPQKKVNRFAPNVT